MNASFVQIRGASEGPLDGADLDLPLGQLVGLVGQDGAGGRELAYQILYLESRRRYAQVLSAFERETLGGAGRAAVDQLSGVPPVLFLDGTLRQRQNVAGYLQLEARLGQLWREKGTSTCPDCAGPCRATTPEMAAEEVISQFAGEPCLVLAPFSLAPAVLEELRRAGFLRVRTGGQVLRIDREAPKEGLGEVVVDRVNADVAHRTRLIEACRQARTLSRGLSLFAGTQSGREMFLNQRLSCLRCGRVFPDWGAGELGAGPSPPYTLTLGGCEWRALAGKEIGEILDLLENQDGCEGLCRPLIEARDLGLGHLPLGRPVDQLSTGEQQGLQLVWCLSLGLTGILYLFEAPSRGLDARGQAALAAGLLRLVAQGSTVVCLDHTPALLEACGAVFECEGGKVGRVQAWPQPPESARRPKGSPTRWLRVQAPRGEWRLPLGRVVCFAGATGTGKSGLLHRVLLPGLHARRGGPVAVEGRPGIQRAVALGRLGGDPGRILLAQTGIFGGVAAIFAETSAARAQGYSREWFMLERPGGRCSTCEGAGVLSCDLEFCDDVSLVCPACEGRRYRPEALVFTWRGLNLSQVLDLRVAAAAHHFRGVPQVGDALHGLLGCGLGHRRLGEAAGRLGPAEGLRLQLAGELRRAGPRELIVLEHPEAGGHPRDLSQLVQVLEELSERGTSVWVETHHPTLTAAADWVVEVGAGQPVQSRPGPFS